MNPLPGYFDSLGEGLATLIQASFGEHKSSSRTRVTNKLKRCEA
jgi:hypothetical protein